MNGDPELDPFTEALREDLPSEAEEARLRVRLASAGILAGAGVLTPAATAAATGAATNGVFAKLVALPLAVKVGASLALAGAAVVPFVQARSHAGHAPAEVSARAVTKVAAPLLPRSAEVARRAELRDGAEISEPSVVATASAAPAVAPAPGAARGLSPATPAQISGGKATARATHEVVPARGAATPATASIPAVASFPSAAAAVEDEGTLRAETAVMERALAAMKQGNLSMARRELALHAAQFPNGHLAPERDRALARIREKETTP